MDDCSQQHYETYVVDDPDAWTRSDALVDTEDDDEMIVMLDDCWHREMTHLETACELPVPNVGQHRRPMKYEGKLCTICFTRKERAIALATKIVDDEERRAHDHAPFEPWDQPKRAASLGDEVHRQRRRSERILTLSKTLLKNEDK